MHITIDGKNLQEIQNGIIEAAKLFGLALVPQLKDVANEISAQTPSSEPKLITKAEVVEAMKKLNEKTNIETVKATLKKFKAATISSLNSEYYHSFIEEVNRLLAN